MNTANVEEGMPLIPQSQVSTDVCDTRQPYKKRLAVYFILGSVLFERIAFYSLADNLVPTLHSNKTLKWRSEHSSTASYTFFGKYFHPRFQPLYLLI